MSTVVKAIETTYKGYRFRSRLEARWAVFFDTLGLKWTYENEGFKLPDGTRYLPDFHLTESDEYVEIKAPNIDPPKLPTIYMAGKIRHPFRKGLEETDGSWGGRDGGYDRPERKLFPLCGVVARYSGPFAFPNVKTGCHIFAHGSEAMGDEGLMQSLAKHCRSGIREADIVVAYIDCATAFGTLVELGYAASCNAAVYLFVDTRKFKEPETCDEDGTFGDVTWFAEAFTNAIVKYSNDQDKRDGVDIFYEWLGQVLPKHQAFSNLMKSNEIKKASSIMAAGKRIHVFAGDPVEHKTWIGSPSSGLLREKMFSDECSGGRAANKARAARFEHGEGGI